MLVNVKINQIECYGYHGTHPAERELGQRFLVDLSLSYNGKDAVESDNIHDAVNYVEIYREVTNIVEESQCQLIETLANVIAKRVLDHFPVIAVEVTLTKPKIPVKANLQSVSVTITKTKKD